MTSHSNLDKTARAIMRDNPGMSFLSARRAARRQRATNTPSSMLDALPNVLAHPGFGNRSDVEPCRIPIGQSVDGEVLLDLSRRAGVLCGGMPGTGKTNLMAAVLGHLAGHAEMLVFDGKGSNTMGRLTRSRVRGHGDRPDTLHAVLAILTERMMGSGTRSQALAQAFGPHRTFWEIPAAEREARGFFPIVVAIDEAQPWFDPYWPAEQDRKACAEIITMVQSLIARGHAVGIVVCLSMQRIDSVTIPPLIRNSIGAKIAFGSHTLAQTESVLGTLLPEGFPSPVDFYNRRQTGRGVLVSAGDSPLVVQTYSAADAIHQLAESRHTHQPVTDQALIALGVPWSDLIGTLPS